MRENTRLILFRRIIFDFDNKTKNIKVSDKPAYKANKNINKIVKLSQPVKKKTCLKRHINQSIRPKKTLCHPRLPVQIRQSLQPQIIIRLTRLNTPIIKSCYSVNGFMIKTEKPIIIITAVLF